MAKVSWNYGGKKYSGTLIPSRETSTHRYARTENGKIKSLPKSKSKSKAKAKAKPTHTMADGTVHTGKTHTKNSKALVHKKGKTKK